MASKLLSKTKYLSGLQCPKYLWILFHEPEKIPEADTVTMFRFDQGHLVGELAKKLYPDGIDIPDQGFMGNIKQTKELLEQREALFEASFMVDNIYARTDILNPAGVDEWDIIEVKSATGVKEIDFEDVAFQKFCCQESGIEIGKCFLTHINNNYVRQGEIDVGQLFITQDISAEVEAAVIGITGRIEAMLETISAETCPDIVIGKHCHDPYDCPLVEGCWDFLPENNVFNLYYGGKKSLELFDNGILAIKDIPGGFRLSDKQRIQKECVICREPYIDRAAINNFLSILQYPLYYLDFETFSPAVPLFDGTRPYQKIPFQFSLYIINDDKSEPRYFSFLAEGTEDPRQKLLLELVGLLGEMGSIVVYNQAFESKVLEELGTAFPEFQNRVDMTVGRMVDLLIPFRNFAYYHPIQQGSASLKNVLPALTGKSYEGMAIDNGEDASIAFYNITYGNVPEDVRNKVMANLEEYCKLDTLGMVWIVNQLRDML